MEEEIILERKYSIPYEMFGSAFEFFQKKYVYPRNIIISVILLIAAAANAFNIINGNGDLMNYVLLFACLALAVINIYNPKKIKKNLMKAIKGIEDDVYRIKILPDKLIIGTVSWSDDENGSTQTEEYEEVFEDISKDDSVNEEIFDNEIYFTKYVSVTEKPDYFMVYLKKSMFYLIPKKDFSEEEITVIQIHFQKQLGKNYCKYEK